MERKNVSISCRLEAAIGENETAREGTTALKREERRNREEETHLARLGFTVAEG